MKFLQANALSFVCLAAMFAVGLIMYSSLPETLPTQFSFTGVPQNYMPKQTVVLMLPIIYAITIAATHFLIRFSPEKFAMPNSKRVMDITILSVGILLLALHIGLLVSRGDNTIFQQYLSVGLACFLIIMGNVIGKAERNFVIGIRIPWTLASDENWRATHRFSGKLMVISGLLLIATSFFFISFALTLSLGLGWAIVAIIYSFLFYLKNERPASE